MLGASTSTKDLEAAWADGHEAAIEEMNNPKNSGIRVRLYLMYFALLNDKPLTPEQVKKVWDDAFLTNVIVPILEHIKRHDRVMVTQSEEPDSGMGVHASFFYRSSVRSLEAVIEILKEWRG